MVDETTPLLSDDDVIGPSHVPGLVPADRSDAFRTLVMCFDGTGDKDDDDVTNVIELRNMLYGWDNNGDGDPQLQQVYYQSGIGANKTNIPMTNVEIPLPVSLIQTFDQAVGWTLDDHVIEGYEWLVERYRPGDKICMFGFSRGAYTARALAAMLSKVGLIPAGSPKGTGKQAFDSYKITGKDGWKDSEDFRRKMKCRNVTIEFLGCWDTVNSVGLVTARTLPYTAFNKNLRTFRHAVSLDEHRARFRTNMWGRPPIKVNNEKKDVLSSCNNTANSNGVQNGDGSNGTIATGVQLNGAEARNRDIHGPIVDGKHHTAPNGEDLDAKKPEPPVTVNTNVSEVWFAGCHCDIGGGLVPNGTRPNLAHIPFRWMIREIFKTKAGIIFKKAGLISFGLHPDTLYPVVKKRPAALDAEPSMRVMSNPAEEKPGVWSRVGSWLWNLNPFASKPEPEDNKPTSGFEEGYDTMSEEQLDLRDALALIYDQLVLKKSKWWPLERWWMNVWSMKQGQYIRRRDLGRGRRIFLPFENADGGPRIERRLCEIRVHRTVKTRMQTLTEDGKSYYIPKALLDGKDGMTLDKPEVQKLIHWVE